jgi:hypothetical protein
MLTLEQLKAMPERTIFATGVTTDTPDGLFMANTGRELRWVAERGGIHDWTIYCHFSEYDAEWVRRHGDKVFSENHIRKLVPCDDEAFAMYRY